MERTIKMSGFEVPRFFYGTAWKEEDTIRCVTEALAAGFRSIDTANQRKHYYEEAVGRALVESYINNICKREDLFLQTKFTHVAGQDERLPYEAAADTYTQVMQSFESSLRHLHAEYIDSFVLHGPSTRAGLAQEDWDVWQAMEDIASSSQAKLIGVSNVILPQLEFIYEHSRVKPHFVQNRCYANTRWDFEVRDFCNKNGILYQGFSLLTANKWVLEHREIQDLAYNLKISPEQLIFAFAMEVGMLPLTGTSDPEHMKEDLESFEISLDKKQIHLIENIK